MAFWVLAGVVALGATIREGYAQGGGPPGGIVQALAIDPTNPATLYAGTDGGGVFKSTNGGASWSAGTGFLGLSQIRVFSVAVDPLNGANVFAGTHTGIFRSMNGGGFWFEACLCYGTEGIRALAIDPANPAIIYAGTGGLFGAAAVFKSTNGGTSWVTLNTGLTASSVRALAIDPSNTATLYAATNVGVFKSTDSGTNWTAVNSGIANTDVRAVVIDPINPNTVYAATFYGVFKSINAGTSWSSLNFGASPLASPLAIDPKNPATIYAHAGACVLGQCLFKSTDGGTNWTLASSGLPSASLLSLAIDPFSPTTLYVGTRGAGVFKSTDGGATWQPTGGGTGGGAPRPAVNDGGVVNNASFAPSPAPLAPGSIAAVFGSNLNNGSTVLFSSFGPDGKLVTSLGGASVTINNIPAPMFYSTPGQLGVQIPTELAVLTSATIQVTVGGQTSVSRTIFLDALAPGIFTLSQDGRGAAVALHEDGVTPVTVERRARPGEVVVLFATGLGAVSSPPLATGAPSTGNRTVSTPTVLFGAFYGQPAVPGEVLFSGTAPGFVGLYQVNVRIPRVNFGALPSGANTFLTMVLSIGGKQSNPVTIAVSP